MGADEAAGNAPTRIRLDLGYDGTAFAGWAKQPDRRTVQGVLEDALATIFRRHGEPPALTVAGRTDAGVHALGQVAHLDLDREQLASLQRPRREVAAPHGVDGLARRIDGVLGALSDVYVRASSIAPPGFDARFSAIWRRYEYRIADAAAVHDPRRRGHTLWHPSELHLDRMNAAADVLLGIHDFAAFCKPRPFATTIRDLQEFHWTKDGDGVLIATVTADAFCHSMVRALVGACVAAGEGRLTPERVDAVRAAAERTSAFAVLPAHGLTLLEVGYPPDDELAARAEQTRARRAADEAVGRRPVDLSE